MRECIYKRCSGAGENWVHRSGHVDLAPVCGKHYEEHRRRSEAQGPRCGYKTCRQASVNVWGFRPGPPGALCEAHQREREARSAAQRAAWQRFRISARSRRRRAPAFRDRLAALDIEGK